MGLDIRLPIGMLFAILGALVTAFGLVSDSALYQRSLDFNINLWWGLVMLVFGALMILASWRRPAAPPERHAAEPPLPEGESPAR